MDDVKVLLDRLDRGRENLESLLEGIDPTKEIFPGWSLKQFLDHITGWDEVVTNSLRSHTQGKTPETPAAGGIDQYNDQVLTAKARLNPSESMLEFKTSRHNLKQALQDMPEETFLMPITAPWGPMCSVAKVIEILAHHEEKHAAELQHLV